MDMHTYTIYICVSIVNIFTNTINATRALERLVKIHIYFLLLLWPLDKFALLHGINSQVALQAANPLFEYKSLQVLITF